MRPFSDDDSGEDIYYGVGLEWRFDERLYTALSYSETTMEAEVFDRETDNKVKGLSLSLGVMF